MQLCDAIAELRAELSDPATTLHPQGKRYSDPLLTKWINAGVSLAYAYRKDLFLKTAIIEATKGDLQAPCGFDNVHTVDALTDECGAPLYYLTKTNHKTAGLFPTSRCLSAPLVGGACPKPTSYSVDKNNNGKFIFSPPVACDKVFYRATGSVRPEPFGSVLVAEMGLPPLIQTAALHYARYMAWLTETESASSRTLASGQLTVFFQMLKIYRDIDKQFCQEFCAATTA